MTPYWEFIVFAYLAFTLALMLAVWLLVRLCLLWWSEQTKWNRFKKDYFQDERFHLKGYDARPSVRVRKA